MDLRPEKLFQASAQRSKRDGATKRASEKPGSGLGLVCVPSPRKSLVKKVTMTRTAATTLALGL